MFLLLLGLLVLIYTLADIVWTTLGTHGAGPLTRHLSSALWRVALALHRRRPSHRMLSFAGSIILAFTVVFWILLVWTGWTLVFSSDPASLVDTHTREPADVIGRMYFVAYSISSMGNGDFQPNGSGWRMATAVTTLSGLGALTLAIAFLLEVLGAVVHKRALGAYISDLGGTPRAIIERAWNGNDFDALQQHFVQLTLMLHVYAEQHLAYPVLQYFHSEQRRTAAALRIAAMKETVLLISEGVPAERRLPPMITATLSDAIGGFGGVMEEESVDPAQQPPPPPSLAILRDAGIPTVGDDAFQAEVAKEGKIRRFLAGVLEDDGWGWEEIGQR